MNRRSDTGVRVVLKDLWRTFFADPVRENVVRSHGGGATATSMVLLGLAAFLVAVTGVVLAASLGATPVGPGSAVLGNISEPGLPVTIPTYFYPVFTALLLVSCFVGAFGAVYARGELSVLAVGLIFVSTVPAAGFAWGFRDSSPVAYVGLPSALALPVVVFVLRRVRPAPPVAQVVTCAAAVLAVVPTALAQVQTHTIGGTSIGVSLLARQNELVIGMLSAVVTPAVLLAGSGAVSFGRTVTDFAARAVDVLSGKRQLVFVGAFCVLLAWRVVATIVTLLRAEDSGPMAAKALLLTALLVGAAVWWAWATRGFDETADEVEDGSARGATPVALLLLVILLVPGVLGVVAYVVAAVSHDLRMIEVTNDVNDALGHEWVGTSWQVALGVALVIWAVWKARSHPSVVSAWVGVAGSITVLVLTWNALLPAEPWGGLMQPDYARAALLVVGVATVRELVRWRVVGTAPTSGWMLTAFSAVALTALVAQGTFLDDPFRPILGFTGVGLVFFGLVWGFLTAGAHSSARGLPGLGRTMVMLAYAVLTTTLIAWGDATGGAIDEALSGTLASIGKILLGGALLVSLLAVWIPILFGLAEPAVRKDPEVRPKPHPEERPEPTLSA